MTLFHEPLSVLDLKTPGRAGFLRQFVRVGDQIALGLNGVLNKKSTAVASEAGVRDLTPSLETWEGLGGVDAGFIAVDMINNGIAVFSSDQELGVPTDVGVRMRTAEMIQRRSKGFQVFVDTEGLSQLSEAQQAIGGSPEKR